MCELRECGSEAVLFDLDGVVTDTASVHAEAWKRLFDAFLAARQGRATPAEPFRIPEDYTAYVDGKPRNEGVRAYLRGRGVDLPWGNVGDLPDNETVCGLGNAKDSYFDQVVDERGIRVYAGTIALIETLRAAGVKTACVSSSKNCRPVLERIGLLDHFDVVFDGLDVERENLRGKPGPDCFLRGAALLGTRPQRSAVVEDAVTGVRAGRAGRFERVIAVDRGAGHAALLAAGADVVVDDLGVFLPEPDPLSTSEAS